MTVLTAGKRYKAFGDCIYCSAFVPATLTTTAALLWITWKTAEALGEKQKLGLTHAGPPPLLAAYKAEWWE